MLEHLIVILVWFNKRLDALHLEIAAAERHPRLIIDLLLHHVAVVFLSRGGGREILLLLCCSQLLL